MHLLLAIGLLGCTGKSVDSGAAPDSGAAAVGGLDLAVLTSAGCADPDARDAAPTTRWSLGPDWEAQEDADDTWTQYASGGMAVADLNGDGTPDLYLPSSGPGQLYLSQPDGTWEDVADTHLPAEDDILGVGGAAADHDGDGDLDLYAVVLHGDNRLYENDGTGRFSDVTDTAGVGGDADDSTSATWWDVDGDGDLDLLVANHFEGEHLGDAVVSGTFPPAHDNRLYENDGDGTFTDRTETLPAAFREGYTFAVVAEDLDQDGRLELLAANDFGMFATPNVAIEYVDGAWQEDPALSDLALGIYAMAVGLGDLDGDGWLDLVMTNIGRQALLLSAGGDGWYDAGQARGLLLSDEQTTAWGVALEDLDNDRDLDLALAMGELVMPDDFVEEFEESTGTVVGSEQPDAVFLQGSDGGFTDQGAAWAVDDRGIGRGLLAVDLDGDGWLDLIRRDLDGGTTAFRATCGAEHGLVVQLSDPTGPNTWGIGARVTAWVGDAPVTRTVRAGGTGHATSGSLEVHFGLGPATSADRIEITWPDGGRSAVDDVPAGRVRLTRR